MTQTETNREIIRRAFEAWRQGTSPITDVFAPGMVWRIEGHSAAAKEYRGTQQFAFVGKHARLVPNSDEGVEPPGLLAFPGERVGSPAQHGRLAVREAEPASQPGGHQRHLLSAEPAFLPAPQRSHQ